MTQDNNSSRQLDLVNQFSNSLPMHKVLFAILVMASISCLGKGDRPNFVIIMADDMGLSDLGCYGGEIATPHLDQLAQNGLRFTHLYNNNMCTVTRAALLTGIYHTISFRKKGINPRCATLAETLVANGYTTRMSGKWHLAEIEDKNQWPCQRGFEEFYGTIYGACSFFAPASLKRNNEDASKDFEKPGYYYTDAISKNAAEMITLSPKNKPLLMYVAYTSPHWPLHALKEDIDKYQGRYAKGWDVLRNERYQRMLQLGIISKDMQLSPRNPLVPRWEDSKSPEWQQRRMEVYAAQIDRMDQGIGRIINSLKKSGRYDNTVIMFLIDNGGCHVEYTTTRTGPYLPKKTRGGKPVKAGNINGLMPGPENTYQSYGYGWANASNTPFRLYKQFCHEGGIRTPLIVHWPAGLKTKPGSIIREVGHVFDIMPTCLELAGVKALPQLNGEKTYSQNGRSLAPIFQDKQRKPHPVLYWDHSQGAAIRKNGWKLVRAGRRKANWELYKIDEDQVELKNLATKYPDKVEILAAEWTAWRARTRAMK